MTDTVCNNLADEAFVKDCFRAFGLGDFIREFEDIARYANENDIPLEEAARMTIMDEIKFINGKGVKV